MFYPAKHALLFIAASFLAGCGAVTPQYQEFWGTPQDNGDKEAAIAAQVKCELSRALTDILATDKTLKPPRLGFLRQWGIQSLLQLTIDEKTTITPGLSINSPLPNAITTFGPMNTVSTTQLFTGTFGGSASREANRVDKINFFYTVDELIDSSSLRRSCLPPPVKASLFDATDLGIDEWLRSSFNMQEFRLNDFNRGKINNVISHDIKFEIVTSGNLTPTWKLVRFSGNNVNPFFSVSRDRTQELIITMGPQDKQFGGLVPAAQALSLSSQFGASVAAQLRPSM